MMKIVVYHKNIVENIKHLQSEFSLIYLDFLWDNIH